jgi:hypothetical protein
VLILALGVAGCTSSVKSIAGRPDALPGAPLPKPTRGVTESLPGEQATREGQSRASRKRVDGKDDPATLIAFDHSTCTVTTQKFKDTKVGDTVSCDWSPGDRRP